MLIALAVLTLRLDDAMACQCEPPPLADSVARATLVFSGHIVAEHESESTYSYTVTVDHVWKGTVARTVEVPTGSGMGDCSTGRLRAKDWLFVTNGLRFVRMCGGSEPTTPAVIASVTRLLGAPKSPS